METIKLIHSQTRWLILLAGIVAIVMAMISYKKEYNKSENTASLVFMILCDIQLLIGLILFFNSPNGLEAWMSYGFDLVRVAPIRKIALEHVLLMLLAIMVVHVARSRVKRASTDKEKHRITLRNFILALILILAGIPWDRLKF
ncbi:MAG: hypothetical protein H7321_06560 [Bacteroidia bacterium]|nr:hypothetical protein [Bacteroidia bacterium]